MKRRFLRILGAIARLFAGKVQAPAPVASINYKDCVHIRAPWGQQMRISAPAPLPKKLRQQMRRQDREQEQVRQAIEAAKNRNGRELA